MIYTIIPKIQNSEGWHSDWNINTGRLLTWFIFGIFAGRSFAIAKYSFRHCKNKKPHRITTIEEPIPAK